MKSRNSLNLRIVVAVEKDGDAYHAFCPALKGLHVDGDTESEAMENAKEAIIVYLDSLAAHGDPLPVGEFLKVEKVQPAAIRRIDIPCPNSLQMCGVS